MRSSESGWSYVTNHGYVLACLAAHPEVRLRDVASLVGITERAVQKLVSDLEAAGVLQRTREGRRNRYQVNREQPMRHSLGAHRTVGEFLDLLRTSTPSSSQAHDV
jgi:DNA-binding IclR family transcriptional regulator